jgi:CheY-like chemotaxis protein
MQSDESKLGQILRNLVSNALKFTPQGEVRVSTEVSDGDRSIVFKVKDTGIGISLEDQERIFHEFAQVEHPIQKHVKGTGLGLPLSRKLTDLLGGILTVESALGSGSTFTLTLPLQAEASSVEEPASGSPTQPCFHAKTVLVIDDEATTFYLVRRLFDGTNHALIEVSALEAMETAQRMSPALILLDLTMPGRSGFEILDDLKANEATREIPVIIHSSRMLTREDYARLADRQAGVLPKLAGNRHAALQTMRKILGESQLFAAELEVN